MQGIIDVHPQALQCMRRHVAEEAPLEACGLVGGRPGVLQVVYPVTNSLQSRSRYRMDGQEQLAAFLDIESAGLALLAIYHSHPTGPQTLSDIDREELRYPDLLQLVWFIAENAWTCRAYHVLQGDILELQLREMSE